MNTSGIDLDISWLKDMYKEAEKDREDDAAAEGCVAEGFVAEGFVAEGLEPCVMSSIQTCFIYVTPRGEKLDLTVERVVKGSIDLEEDDVEGVDEAFSFISKESLYNLITLHHKLDKRLFKLTDILLYNSESGDITKITTIYKDLEIPASLPMYHDINSLIFIFREKTPITAAPLQLSTVLPHIVPDEVIGVYRKTRKHRGGGGYRAGTTRKAKHV